jgi:hypothetical protein
MFVTFPIGKAWGRLNTKIVKIYDNLYLTYT